MARPIRKGLAYFPLDSDFLSDRKIQRLLQNHSHTGICTYLTLLCEIYSTHGYYYPYSPDLSLDIAFTLQTHEEKVQETLFYCLQIGLFDKGMFERYRILTSHGIQTRYMQVHKRKIEIHPAYVLEAITPVSDTKTRVSEAITPVSDAETPVSDSKTPPKGKGEGKGKGEKEKSVNTKKKITSENKPDEDDIRRSELQRLKEITTGHSKNA